MSRMRPNHRIVDHSDPLRHLLDIVNTKIVDVRHRLNAMSTLCKYLECVDIERIYGDDAQYIRRLYTTVKRDAAHTEYKNQFQDLTACLNTKITDDRYRITDIHSIRTYLQTIMLEEVYGPDARHIQHLLAAVEGYDNLSEDVIYY